MNPEHIEWNMDNVENIIWYQTTLQENGSGESHGWFPSQLHTTCPGP